MMYWIPYKDQVVQHRLTRRLGLVVMADQNGFEVDWETSSHRDEFVPFALAQALLRPYWLQPKDEVSDHQLLLTVHTLEWTDEGVNLFTSRGHYLAPELYQCRFPATEQLPL